MREKLNELIYYHITDNLGDYIVESVWDMVKWSDFTFMQKLAVIDGAIALGAWQNTPSQMKALRDIRSAVIEDNENDRQTSCR